MTDNTEPSGTAAADFAAALRGMSGVLDGLPALLEGARVHDFAFGKLFEASEVRDAYHQRLPETENDLTEARDVIEHFVAGLEGGHSIASVMAAAAAVPEQAGRAEP